MLAHPDSSAPLALFTKAPTTAMGAMLQQHVRNAWQPLVFFSRKLSPAQQKYSAYYRELLAIYEAVQHFRHMLEARHFIIFMDHKPLVYAFNQKRASTRCGSTTTWTTTRNSTRTYDIYPSGTTLSLMP
jgi:hypothetical protein